MKSSSFLVSVILVCATVTVCVSAAIRAERPSDPAVLAAAVAELRAEVAALKDRQKIHDLYLRYMRGFDRSDIELLRSSFWPDVQINYGSQSNTFDEFVARHLDAQTKKHAKFAHLITNESVDIAGDVAHVESYVTQFISGKDGKSMIVGGRYIDRLDRRNGEWRITVREFIFHFFTETNTALDAYVKPGSWSPAPCAMGTWNKHDPSYQRPLTARTDKKVGPACAK